jgi:uncharacterized membrane protein YhhN
VTSGTQAALVVAGVVAVLDWAAVLGKNLRRERMAKPAVIACLIVAVLLGDPGASPARWLLVAALAASLVGDWLLLPSGRFTPGLVAFLVAHLAYLAVFLREPLSPSGLALGLLAAAVVLVMVGRVILAGAARTGERLPVAIYLIVISAMAVAASGSGSVPATIGAWLFVASDAMLGWDRFVGMPAVTADADARRRVLVMVTYHAAQVVLTIAILTLGGS